MHLNRVLRRFVTMFVSLCFIFSCFFVNTISADDDPDSLVDAIFEIEFVTGTDLVVDVTMDARKLTIDSIWDADMIKNAEGEDLGALRLAIYQLLRDQLDAVFENADISNFEMPVFNGETFDEVLNVTLTSSFFELNDSVNSEELINGALDMGAVITYNFNLQAEHGWNNTFTYVLSNSMDLGSANNSAEVNLQNTEITWTLENWNGGTPNKLVALSVRFENPTTPASQIENISLEFKLDTSNINSISLKATILAENVDIRDYDILPDFITELDFVPSDGIRLFIDNGLLSWDALYLNTIKHVEQNTISVIESSNFNQTLDMSFNWDVDTTTNCSTPYNTTSMDSVPPIKAELVDEDVDLRLCDMSARAFFGLVNAGAGANISSDDINFGDKLDEIGCPYEVFLYLPNNVSLDGKNVYSWNLTSSISGEFVSGLQPDPEYSKEEIDIYIEIEISKMDLNIPSFFTGKTELTATVHIKEDDNLYVMRFPEEFEISEKINLTYLNSDAFRLCSEESVLNDEDVDVYLNNKKDVFETRLSDVLDGLKIKGIIDKKVFSESLNWDGDISYMEGVDPVIVSTYANNLYSVGFKLSFWPPAISISNQTFNLASLENRSVTYRIVFPKGISVRASDTLNKSIIKGKTSDGREYVELSFASGDDVETDILLCKLSASPFYVLGLFLPCIISLILVVVLIIIVYLIRKKRKGGKVKQEDVDLTGYEEQDYYVPPPPDSK